MKSSRKCEPGNGDGADELVASRCLLYLLGEMHDGQAAAFEAELAESADLQAELLAQSAILVGLSSVAPSSVAPSSVASSAAVSPLVSSLVGWRVVTTVAAIAACLLLAWLVRPLESGHDQAVVDSASESLLIAHAWAEESLSATSITDLLSQPETDVDADPVEASAGSDQGLAGEASLSWLVSAVEAGAI